MEEFVSFDFPNIVDGVVISPQTLRTLWTWTVTAETEISAFGEVEIIGTKLHLTDKIHLVKQRGSMVSTCLDMSAVDELMRNFLKENKPTEGLRFWFHTHPRMSAFFSPTDEDTIELLTDYMPFVLAAVFNTAGKTEWCLSGKHMRILWSHILPGVSPTKEECDEVRPLIKQFVREDTMLFGWRKGRKKRDYFFSRGSWE